MKKPRNSLITKSGTAYTSISGSVLAGSLVSANSLGMMVSHAIREEELAAIKMVFDGNITIMDSKKTAYGNLVLANDKGAIVDPRFKETEIEKISKALGVEAVPTEIAGLPYVGSLAVATNKGVLAHPLLKDEERKILEACLQSSRGRRHNKLWSSIRWNRLACE